MSPIFKQFERDEAPESARDAYDRCYKWRGMIPAPFKTLAAIPTYCSSLYDHYVTVISTGVVSSRIKTIVGLRVARLNRATHCGSSLTYRAGKIEISEAMVALLAAPAPAESPDWSLFTNEEQLAIQFGDKMSLEPWTIDEAYYTPLRRVFTDAQILELVCLIGIANYFNRMGLALNLPPDKHV